MGQSERESKRGRERMRGKEGRLNKGEGGCKEGAARWGKEKEKGEFSQTGDALYNDRMGGE